MLLLLRGWFWVSFTHLTWSDVGYTCITALILAGLYNILKAMIVYLDPRIVAEIKNDTLYLEQETGNRVELQVFGTLMAKAIDGKILVRFNSGIEEVMKPVNIDDDDFERIAVMLNEYATAA